MKAKVAIISTGVLLSAVTFVHVTHHCPLQMLKGSAAKTTAAPAPANADAKPATVVLR
ncbi:MAG TPA: hypothetical protein VHB48_12080 [Chitinophagaceae bacterium]|jgi:hypothetical protein|nr:hypothetical protein [Chitinophagaceae bacterium]